MFRQSIARPLTTTTRLIGNRSFSALAPRMGEGDAGAPKPGGAQHSYVYLFFPSAYYVYLCDVFPYLPRSGIQWTQERRESG